MNNTQEHVFIFNPPHRAVSEELTYAAQALIAGLEGMQIHYLERAHEDFVLAAKSIALSNAYPSGTFLIFVAHPAIRLGNETLTVLRQATLGRGGVAYVPDRRVVDLSPPPDYLTLGGFDRYTNRLAGATTVPMPAPGFPALVIACRAGQVSLADFDTPYFPRGAFCQDFGAYHQASRAEMLPWVPPETRSILDVGGGEGGFLSVVKAALSCETHLSEQAKHACIVAQSRVDRVWQGNFLDVDFGRKFDCISFLEVLEHTIWPARWLEKARELITPQGKILISVPNVGHWSVIADLIHGRWDYAPAGIHCVTHLRFFTHTGLMQLLRESGLVVERFEAVQDAAPAWFRHGIGDFGGQISPCPDSYNCAAFYALARRG